MNKIEALHSFWSGFNIPAYDVNSVPDDATLPYITYEVSEDGFGSILPLTANVWYRSNSWVGITSKVQEIATNLSRGGRVIEYDGGALWIQKSSPWAQRLGNVGDETIRRIVLNVTIEFLD